MHVFFGPANFFICCVCSVERLQRDKWTLLGPMKSQTFCPVLYNVSMTEDPLQRTNCSFEGPPDSYWDIYELKNIPDKDASTL